MPIGARAAGPTADQRRASPSASPSACPCAGLTLHVVLRALKKLLATWTGACSIGQPTPRPNPTTEPNKALLEPSKVRWTKSPEIVDDIQVARRRESCGARAKSYPYRLLRLKSGTHIQSLPSEGRERPLP